MPTGKYTAWKLRDLPPALIRGDRGRSYAGLDQNNGRRQVGYRIAEQIHVTHAALMISDPEPDLDHSLRSRPVSRTAHHGAPPPRSRRRLPVVALTYSHALRMIGTPHGKASTTLRSITIEPIRRKAANRHGVSHSRCRCPDDRAGCGRRGGIGRRRQVHNVTATAARAGRSGSGRASRPQRVEHGEGRVLTWSRRSAQVSADSQRIAARRTDGV
jgi:hypothetical protein